MTQKKKKDYLVMGFDYCAHNAKSKNNYIFGMTIPKFREKHAAKCKQRSKGWYHAAEEDKRKMSFLLGRQSE